MSDQRATAEVFEALGHDAETARYYASLDDGGRRLARSTFVHLMSELVIDPNEQTEAGEAAWIESWLRWSRTQGTEPQGVAASVSRLLKAGIDPSDLTAVVVAMQREVVENALSLLDADDVRRLQQRLPGLPDVSWRLFQVDADPRKELTPRAALEDLRGELEELAGAKQGAD